MSVPVLDNVQVGDTLGFDVSITHPEYDNYKETWEKCRDCKSGEEAIKSKSTKYLPKLDSQTIQEYENYKMRSQFYGATGRTVSAYLGMIFRKDPSYTFTHDGEESIELNDFFERFLSVVTHDGKSLDDFIHFILEEIIISNRVGVLVDTPAIDPIIQESMTMQDYEDMKFKPLLSMYKAETILNWYTVIMDNQVVPVMFVLYEPQEQLAENSLVHEVAESYRILYLENWEDRDSRRYKSIVVTRNKTLPDLAQFQVTDVSYPTLDGAYIKFIPFYVLTDKGIDNRRLHVPMINDLANVNLGHYRNSADHENELHWISLKTLALPDWDKATYGDPKIGGAMAVPKDCIPHLIEPSSDSSIKEEMILKEQRLAVLGSERISLKGKYIASAATAQITASSEAAVLTDMVLHSSKTITKVLNFLISWAKPALTQWPGDIKCQVRINDDLVQDDISGADLRNYIDAIQRGGISYDVFYYMLQKRELYPPGWTKEKEWDAILKTNDTFFQHAVNNIVEGKTDNVFFRQEEGGQSEGADPADVDSRGRGEGQVVRVVSDREPRVRLS